MGVGRVMDGFVHWGPSRRMARLLIALLIIADCGLGLYWLNFRIPDNWKPWGPAQLDQAPTMLAKLQLNILKARPAACFAALDRSALSYQRMPERPLVNGCGLVDGVRFLRSHASYSSVFDATCALGAALYWWEQSLDAAAMAQFGAHLVRIDHVGSYACRNVYWQEGGRRSQHAIANAIDVSGFRLSDGSVINIAKEWHKNTAKGRFLRRAHEDACRFFNVVLGPDYNVEHAGHFHLDMGPFPMCR